MIDRLTFIWRYLDLRRNIKTAIDSTHKPIVAGTGTEFIGVAMLIIGSFIDVYVVAPPNNNTQTYLSNKLANHKIDSST
jgi:hypothetical protein